MRVAATREAAIPTDKYEAAPGGFIGDAGFDG